MKRLTLVAMLVGMLVALSAGVAWAATWRGASAACDPTKTIVEVHAGEDLDAAMDNTKTCATYLVHNDALLGQTVYSMSKPGELQAYDRVIGISNSRWVRPAIAPASGSKVSPLFAAVGGDNFVQIKNLVIRDAWGDPCVEHASGYGLKVHGTDALIANNKFLRNPNAGIGGIGARMHVVGNLFVDNGRRDFGDSPCWPSQAAQIKVTGVGPLIEDNTFRGGEWNGIWCDVNCDGAVIRENLIESAGKTGIFVEISEGPTQVYANEVHKAGANPTLEEGKKAPALWVLNSSNVDASKNTFGNNPRGAFVVSKDPNREGEVSNVKFRENTLNGDAIPGCSHPGVICTNNR